MALPEVIPGRAWITVSRHLKTSSALKTTENNREIDCEIRWTNAATATRKGEEHFPKGEQITWNEMQMISDYWTKDFRRRLDELRSVSPPQ
jgi:hypothetical protein